MLKYEPQNVSNTELYIELCCNKIRTALENAVEKRMMSDRKIGCLLSGGLDSSLIAALVSKFHKQKFPDEKLMTFSIGMPGGTDLEYARMVADHIGSDHHEIIVTEQDFCDYMEEVVYKIESDDTTTCRASIGNYLVSKYISENTDCIVIFNGDGSDEVCGGYIYFQNAPTPDDFHKECISLLELIHLYGRFEIRSLYFYQRFGITNTIFRFEFRLNIYTYRPKIQKHYS